MAEVEGSIAAAASRHEAATSQAHQQLEDLVAGQAGLAAALAPLEERVGCSLRAQEALAAGLAELQAQVGARAAHRWRCLQRWWKLGSFVLVVGLVELQAQVGGQDREFGSWCC